MTDRFIEEDVAHAMQQVSLRTRKKMLMALVRAAHADGVKEGRESMREEAAARCHARNFQWCMKGAPAWPWVVRTRGEICDAIRALPLDKEGD